MRDLAEHVEGASHIDFFPCLHIQEREIDRAAPAVARPAGDIALSEQLLFFQGRIKIGLHAKVQILDPPQSEVFDRSHRPVCVKDLKAVPLHICLIGSALERAGRLFGEQRAGLFIPVNTVPDEIIRRIIADLLNDPRHIVRKEHKAGGIHCHGLLIVIRHFHASFLSL